MSELDTSFTFRLTHEDKTALAELAERAPRMLPTTVIDGRTYFVDERLRQLRNVKNPHDYIDLDG